MEKDISVEGTIGIRFEDPVLFEDFDTKQSRFVAQLQKDSLACGAIPNPHAFVKVPKMKVLPFLFHFMFKKGLPRGWGK